MNTTHIEPVDTRSRVAGITQPLKVTLLMVALIGSFYLLREHWNHVAGSWVYLILLACTLMHLFYGHGGHGRHGGHPKPPGRED